MTIGWDTSCLDWEERLLSGRSLIPDLPLFEDEVAKALRVFKRLRLPDVNGMPTMAEACGDWFYPFVSAIFGSYDVSIERRMVQEFFQLIPKGNAKSSNAGAIMVVAMIMCRRPRAELQLIAPTKEIADIAFNQAKGTIECDPSLKDLFHPQQHIRTITHLKSQVKMKIKAADTDTVTGSKAYGTLIDETHEFAKKANAAAIFLELRGALGKRKDGFLIQTTTQSKEPPTGQFKEELKRARDVRDGKLKIPLLPLIYELPMRLSEKGGWKNRKYWPLINPNLGRSLDEEFLINQLASAEQSIDRPKAEALLASQHFNVEVVVGQHSDRWAGAEYWEQQADPAITLDEILRRCEVVVVGMDGGGLDDLLGLTVLGREAREIEIDVKGEDGNKVSTKLEKRWLSWSKAWCHKSVLARRVSIASRLQSLHDAGEITIVDRQSDGVDQAVAIVSRVKDEGLLYCVAVDPMGLGTIVDSLAAIDVTEQNQESKANFIIGVSQGIGMMTALKTAENKLADGTLIHSVQELMNWCVGNIKIESTATAIRATKQNAGDAKIDPAMALFDAVMLMARNPEAVRGVYDLLKDAAEEQPAEEGPLDDGIDAQILADPSHPRFQEMKDRWETQNLSEEED